MNNIADLRKQIDALDEKIIDALAQRFFLVKKVGEQKKALGIPVQDKNREKEKILVLSKKAAQYNIKKETIEKIWHIIFRDSYEIEQK